MLHQGWDLKMYPRQIDDMYWKQRAGQLYNMERMLMVLYLGMVFAIWFQVSSFVKEDRFFIELVIIIMALNLVGALFAMRYKMFYFSWRTPVLTVYRISQTMVSIVSMVVLRGTQEGAWRFDSQKVTFAAKLVGLSHNPFKIMDVFGMQVSGSICWRLFCACIDVELLWDVARRPAWRPLLPALSRISCSYSCTQPAAVYPLMLGQKSPTPHLPVSVHTGCPAITSHTRACACAMPATYRSVRHHCQPSHTSQP